MERYQLNLQRSFQSLVPMERVAWNLANSGVEVDFSLFVRGGRPGGSVGRPVPGGSEGSVGVGNRVGDLRDRDLRRSPTLKIPQ